MLQKVVVFYKDITAFSVGTMSWKAVVFTWQCCTSCSDSAMSSSCLLPRHCYIFCCYDAMKSHRFFTEISLCSLQVVSQKLVVFNWYCCISCWDSATNSGCLLPRHCYISCQYNASNPIVFFELRHCCVTCQDSAMKSGCFLCDSVALFTGIVPLKFVVFIAISLCSQ